MSGSDKKRARLNCMTRFPASQPYPGKSSKISRGPDPLIVDASARVIGTSDHMVGRSLHPNDNQEMGYDGEPG